MCVYRCEGVTDAGGERDRAKADGGTGGSDMRMCVFVCVQVQGRDGGRERECGCEGDSAGEREWRRQSERSWMRGRQRHVCVCGYEGVTEAEPQKMNVRDAAICVCVRVRWSDGWRDRERQSERRWRYGRQRDARVCVCVFVCLCVQVQGRDGGGEREGGCEGDPAGERE